MNTKLTKYFKIQKSLDQTINNILEDPDTLEEIKNDFSKRYPDYRIGLLYSMYNQIWASVYHNSSNKVKEPMAFPNSDGTWNF